MATHRATCVAPGSFENVRRMSYPATAELTAPLTDGLKLARFQSRAMLTPSLTSRLSERFVYAPGLPPLVGTVAVASPVPDVNVWYCPA